MPKWISEVYQRVANPNSGGTAPREPIRRLQFQRDNSPQRQTARLRTALPTRRGLWTSNTDCLALPPGGWCGPPSRATGAFRPVGARSAGQEVIADALDDRRARHGRKGALHVSKISPDETAYRANATT